MFLYIAMSYLMIVRTTLSLDDDVTAAVRSFRRERQIGLSEAVNELIRAGLSAPPRRKVFQQHTADLGLRVNVTNVAEALELLEGPGAR